MGRYERTASEFFSEYIVINKMFSREPLKQMSKLTQNILHGIDYEYVKYRRTENFSYLENALGNINSLELNHTIGAYMYPFFIKNGSEIRKRLQKDKIYIPILWPHVFNICTEDKLEYQMANNILPLPVDQRYDLEDMKYLTRRIMECID